MSTMNVSFVIIPDFFWQLALFSGLFNFITRPWSTRPREVHLEDVEEGGSDVQDTNPAAKALYDRAEEVRIVVPQGSFQ